MTPHDPPDTGGHGDTDMLGKFNEKFNLFTGQVKNLVYLGTLLGAILLFLAYYFVPRATASQLRDRMNALEANQARADSDRAELRVLLETSAVKTCIDAEDEGQRAKQVLRMARFPCAGLLRKYRIDP